MSRHHAFRRIGVGKWTLTASRCFARSYQVPRHPRVSARRWIVFEQGRKAHELRSDDLFSAECTLCGKPALDADFHPLPRFNSFPADYLLCRVCCVLHARGRF